MIRLAKALVVMNKTLTDEFYYAMKERLAQRLKAARFEHSIRVADTAVQLAQVYGVDTRKARIAGLLHDWDKGYDNESIQKRARELKIEVDPYVFERMPKLLHGITAAAALHEEFPELDDDVIRAIERHTSGAIDMSNLDMIVYVADVIEPSRLYSAMDDLRALVGQLTLEELFLKTYKQVFSHLIAQDYRIHPDSIDIWNYYISRANSRDKQKGLL